MRPRAWLLAVCLAPAGAFADRPPPDPLHAYLAANPSVRGEELIDVSAGDGVDRVLAVIHNPDSGLVLRALRVSEIRGGVALERSPEELAGAAGQASQASFLILVTQSCDDRQPRPRMLPGSWIFLRENALVAFDVVRYAPDCRITEERSLAADHDALRVVGEQLFRKLGRGRFRYGALQYDVWDDAFAAPTREATLSLLRARAASDPDDGSVQNRLAVALHAAGERDAAFERLQRAAALDPGAAAPHRNLAAVHRQRGEREEAARQDALAAAAGALP